MTVSEITIRTGVVESFVRVAPLFEDFISWNIMERRDAPFLTGNATARITRVKRVSSSTMPTLTPGAKKIFFREGFPRHGWGSSSYSS